MVLPLEGVDLAGERRRLEGELARVEREVARLERLLADPGFMVRAPQEVREREQERLAVHRQRQQRQKRMLKLVRA